MRTVDTGRAAACALERRQRDFQPILREDPYRFLASARARPAGWSHFVSGARAVSDAQRSSRCGALLSPCGAATARLCRQHLEHVAVRVSEIKTASATTVIDLHVVEGAGSAAISNALGADAIEDAVKLRLI